MKPDRYGMITCSQCGEYQPKSEHRKYFPSQTKGQDRESYYKQCKRCERINKRYTYLMRKDPDTLTQQDHKDMQVTEMLYNELKARGFEVPSVGCGRGSKDDSALDLLMKITKGAAFVEPTDQEIEIAEDKSLPKDLAEMLYKDFHGLEPEKLYDQYDALRVKYAPQVGVDDDFKPIYSEEYKELLQAILEKIEVYEDGLY